MGGFDRGISDLRPDCAGGAHEQVVGYLSEQQAWLPVQPAVAAQPPGSDPYGVRYRAQQSVDRPYHGQRPVVRRELEHGPLAPATRSFQPDEAASCSGVKWTSMSTV